MLAIIVTAHNEAQRIERCLASLRCAAEHPSLASRSVMTIVVADDCSDDTETVARAAGAVTVTAGVRNPGLARAAGADLAVWAGATWLSFLDAHAIVEPDWLAAQVAAGSDVVCGQTLFRDEESVDATRPLADPVIHAGNFGLSAALYCKTPCFVPVSGDRDDTVSRALLASGATIVDAPAMRAIASGRRAYRPPIAVPHRPAELAPTRVRAA